MSGFIGTVIGVLVIASALAAPLSVLLSRRYPRRQDLDDDAR